MRIEIPSEEQLEEKKEQELSTQAIVAESSKEALGVKNRMRWLWDYYKWYVIIPVAVLAAGVYTYFCFIREVGPTYLRTTMINAVMTDETEVTFDDAFMDAVKPEESEGKFLIDTGLVHPKVIDDTNSGDTVVVASVQKYNALIINGETDVTISSDWVIQQFAPSGCYYDLKTVLPDELYKKIEDRIYFCEGPEGTGQIAAAIRLDGVRSVLQFYEGQEVPVLAVSSRTDSLEHAIAFIQWLIP